MSADTLRGSVSASVARRVGYRQLILGVGILLAFMTVVVNIGAGSACVVASTIAAGAATRAMWRRSRALVFSLLSTVVAWLAVWAVGVASDPQGMLTGGFAYYSAYLLAIPAITLSVWAARRTPTGNRGVTVVLAHIALVITVPIRLIYVDTGAAPVAGLLLAVAVVWWRTRLDPPVTLPANRFRRIITRVVRAVAVAMSSLFLLTAALLGGTGTAHAFYPFDGIADSVSSTVKDTVCGVTAPDLSAAPVGTGPESWFSNRNLVGAKDQNGKVPDNAKDVVLTSTSDMSQYTLYEVSGLRGLTWVNWQYAPGSINAQPETCSLSTWIWTISANAVFTFNLYLLQATIAMKELSQSKNPVSWLYDATDSAIAKMFVHFAVPAMAVAMMISAIVLGVGVARRGNSRDDLGKVGASLGVMVLAGFIFGGLSITDSGPSMESPNGSGFYVLASTLDQTLGEMNSVLAAGLLSNLHEDGTDNAFCSIQGGDSANIGQRVSSCVLAETLAYQPWAVGQFGPAGMKPITATATDGPPKPNAPPITTAPGVTPGVVEAKLGDDKLPCYVKFGACHDLRTYLIAQQGGPAIAKLVNECLAVAGPYSRIYANTCVPYFAAAQQLSVRIKATNSADQKDSPGTGTATSATETEAATAMYSAFSGSNGLARLSQACSAIVATIVIAITLLTLAVITLVWHMILYALFMMGPLTFTVGSYMGKTNLVRTWVIDVLHTFTARFAYSFAMTLIIYIVCLVFRSPSIYGGLKILLVGLILYGFWKLVSKIDDYIRPEGGSLNTNIAGATQQQVRQARQTYRSNALTRSLRRQNGGSFRATRKVVRGGVKTAKFTYGVADGTARRTVSVGRAGARVAGKTANLTGNAVLGGVVGATNTLGGKHKTNNALALELGYGKGRMFARRAVGGLVVGVGGGMRGAYQGTRGRRPSYQPGAARPVDSAIEAAREARFLAAHAKIRTKEGVQSGVTNVKSRTGTAVRAVRPVPLADRVAARKSAEQQTKSNSDSA